MQALGFQLKPGDSGAARDRMRAPRRQGATLGSKLVLLTVHFPRLRLLWSRSLHATADLFRALKDGRDEPDPLAAAAVGARRAGPRPGRVAAARPPARCSDAAVW